MADALIQRGMSVDALHGDLSQPARERVVSLEGELGGGGSGKAGLAWAGGKKVEGLDTALDRFPGLLAERLGAGGS